MGLFKISLDAGHGLDTAGKRVPDNSMHEWEFNQGVVKYIMDELRNYDVKVLRVDDPTGETDVPLGTRTTNINNWGSDVHISVHANAASDEWGPAHGIETFTYLTPSKASTELAIKVQKSLIKATGLTDRGVKKADFHMLRKSNMPAILVECGFMSNKEEANLLKSDDYRKKVALAIIAGIAEQFDLKKRAAVATKPQVKVNVITGWYTEGSSGLAALEKFLKDHGWKYRKEQVK
ncbi:N-acetylmuramoyl-L-alanine amidase [Bacillus sp. ISL-46]|uniref:N-acetylmuramoyl-L-alanine amidase n=1 Tax=Bacillus sp. ISL-46 TaxID=2819129 RepID=UPI001BEBBE62|nr:N-acetylmuramoyl-L-alanine amidase [Bacillus sp. ISL-46]MBT2722330.1 N-acetylmuramoyl-L-alanine amidase [Bacillus sp. ISL-46]